MVYFRHKSYKFFIKYKDASVKKGNALKRKYRSGFYGYRYPVIYVQGAMVVVLGLLAIFIILYQGELKKRAACSWICEDINEQEDYRAGKINETLLSYMIDTAGEEQPLWELVTDMYFYEQVYHQEFHGTREQQKKIGFLKKEFQKEYESLLQSNAMIWKDIEYFPVAWSVNCDSSWVTYGDSWRFERSYGGKRTHEGCDIMAERNERGFYPVVSITDGVVEKKGWLEKGGYRLGIRSPQGAYFYYAHLFSYADIEVGEEVRAGELIGFMGDSGYGEEGTTGKFPVHLHIGIYLPTKHNREQSVNPYPVMRYLENRKIQMDYGKKF